MFSEQMRMQRALAETRAADCIRFGVEQGPTPRLRDYAVIAALPKSLTVSAVLAVLAYIVSQILPGDGRAQAIGFGVAGFVLMFGTGLLARLIGAAQMRYNADHAALGRIGSALWRVTTFVRSDRELRHVEHFARQVHKFLTSNKVSLLEVFSGADKTSLRTLEEFLKRRGGTSWGNADDPDKRAVLDAIDTIRVELGGVGWRRNHLLHRSRFAANYLFWILGLFTAFLAGVMGGGASAIVTCFVAGVITHGFFSIISYVGHLEFGVGFDWGDARPDDWLLGVLKDLEEAKKLLGKAGSEVAA